MQVSEAVKHVRTVNLMAYASQVRILHLQPNNKRLMRAYLLGRG